MYLYKTQKKNKCKFFERFLIHHSKIIFDCLNQKIMIKDEEIQEAKNFLDESLNVDSEKLERLIESMIFHENKQLAYNFCLLATTLLVLHSKSPSLSCESSSVSCESSSSGMMAARKNKLERIQHLFELTKNGLFAIILYCDKAIDELQLPKTDAINLNQKTQLDHYIKYLKVGGKYFFLDYFLFFNSQKMNSKIIQEVIRMKNLKAKKKS